MKARRVIIIGFVGLLAAAVAGGFWFKNLANRVFVSPVVSLSAATSPATLKRPAFENLAEERFYDKKPINILLLGYGGGKHDGTYLTDSMMVASIDPKLAKITLVSIPRDIWVDNKKINSFYGLLLKDGPAVAGRAAMDAVEKVTGLTLDRFASVSFDGFEKTIDALGGADVKVDVTFDDFQYPVEGMENELCGHDPLELPAIAATASATKSPELIFPCRYKHLHFDAGTSHMDGVTALEYVRSRHSAQDGSDFGRARRQRNLLVAVKQKVLSADFITKAIPFVNSLGNDVRTDLSLDETRFLLSKSGTISKYQISNLALTDINFLANSNSSDGQFILVPKAGTDNWSDVQKWISDQLSQSPAPANVAVMVENGTNIPKLAQTVSEKLKAAGVNVLGTRNASEKNVTRTRITVYDPNVNRNDLEVIKKNLGVGVVEENGESSAGNANVVIVLGTDYQSPDLGG